MNKFFILTIIIVMIILMLVLILLKPFVDKKADCSQRIEFRTLFSNHAIWTRMFIIAAVNKNKEEIPIIVDRLMKNQEAIGDAIGKKEATELFKEHITLASKVVGYAVEKDKENYDKELKKLKENSDKIADFLTSLNPKKLPNDVLRREFWKHNKLVVDQTLARLDKKWLEDSKILDLYYSHMLMLSDTISNGIE